MGRSVLLPARIQRILSMVRADVRILLCPCSPPLSPCCLAQRVQVPALLPVGFPIPLGNSGRAREEAAAARWDLALQGDYQEGWVMCLCCTRFPRTILSRAGSVQSTAHKASYLPHCASRAVEMLLPCISHLPRVGSR